MQAEQLKAIAREALEDLKGLDITEYDVRGLTTVTDTCEDLITRPLALTGFRLKPACGMP